jgi:hypothetical protein
MATWTFNGRIFLRTMLARRTEQTVWPGLRRAKLVRGVFMPRLAAIVFAPASVASLSKVVMAWAKKEFEGRRPQSATIPITLDRVRRKRM